MTATTIERTGSAAGLGPNTPQNDLRTFIAAVEARGELAHVSGAHWDKEIGAVTEVLYRQKVEKAPMLLFDDVPGYPAGYRCTYGMFGSPYRLGTRARHGCRHSPTIANRSAATTSARTSKKRTNKSRPSIVNDGPIFENVQRGDDIDMLESFPVPIHHELDGGRYIGTACGVVTRDPDTGRINVGTYRVQVSRRQEYAAHPTFPTENKAAFTAIST